MLHNEIEEIVASAHTEEDGFKRKSKGSHLFRHNSNMFKLFTECVYKIDDPDTLYKNIDKICSFEGLDSSDENLSLYQRTSVAMYNAIKKYISDLNGPSNVPILHFEQFLVKNFKDARPVDEDYKSACRGVLNAALDTISDRVYHSLGAINDEVFFWSYGRKPRKTFNSSIDLILMMEDGVELFFISPIHNPKINKSAFSYNNPRIMAAAKHMMDIGIKVNFVHDINIPFGFVHKELDYKWISKRPDMMDGILREATIRFMSSDSTSAGNPGKCSSCPNHSFCGIEKMILRNF